MTKANPELVQTFRCVCGRVSPEVICRLPGDRLCKYCGCGRWIWSDQVVRDALPFLEDDNHPTTPADFGCRLWEAKEDKGHA